MQNEIVINAEGGETRVALLERSVFTELHIERDSYKNVAGNVVKGRVMRVLPGMQAAFVDIGLEKAAFLYVGDYFDNTGTPPSESSNGDRNGGRGNGKGAPKGPRGRGPRRRQAPPPIESVLREGQEIVVQIAKEPIGTKGARITSNISIPGRHLVLTPWSKRVGVSRRIGSDKERKRLREIVDRLKPKDIGFIIRTAGDGVREADLEADIRYLTTVWTRIRQRNAERPAPAVLHEEHDISLRIIRDLANQDTKRIVIDGAEAFEQIKTFAEEFMAEPRPEIERYEGFEPIFDHFELENQIHANLERKVWLKSGGSLVIDQNEALTSIDVNTGRFVGKSDLEETVFKNNLEAVKEVVNQLRFRNIGGLIIIDLIDMEKAEHRDKVYRALQEAIRSDKARTNILKISELGLVEMTRKRTRESLVQTLCEPCPHCEGRGYILSTETVGYKVLREIRTDLPRFCGRQVALTVSPHLAEQLLGPLAPALRLLSEELGREIEVRAKPGMHQEQFEIIALDDGPSVEIPLDWLRDPKEVAAAESSRKSEPKRADSKKSDSKKSEPKERKNGRRSRRRTEKSSDGETDGKPEKNQDGLEAADIPQAQDGADTAEAPASDAGETGGSRKSPEETEVAAAAAESSISSEQDGSAGGSGEQGASAETAPASQPGAEAEIQPQTMAATDGDSENREPEPSTEKKKEEVREKEEASAAAPAANAQAGLAEPASMPSTEPAPLASPASEEAPSGDEVSPSKI